MSETEQEKNVRSDKSETSMPEEDVIINTTSNLHGFVLVFFVSNKKKILKLIHFKKKTTSARLRGCSHYTKQMKFSTADKARTVVISDTAMLVEKILGDKTHRKSLIQEQIALKNEALANKLRFLSTMIELEKFPLGTDRLSKARKVISLFLINGAMFQLPYKQNVYGKDVEQYNVSVLPTIRMHVLEEVASDEAFVNKLHNNNFSVEA